MPNRILYIASTAGHLKSFHLPYLEQLRQDGWIVHTAGRGASEALPGAELGIEIPFEKSMFSPRNLAATLQLRRVLREGSYDIVSVHTSLAAFFTRLAVMLSGRRREILVINTVHGYLFDDDTPWFKRTALLWAEKLTASATDLLLTMNRQDTEIAHRYRLCRGEVIKIDGMGVDFSRFAPANTEQRLVARQRVGLPTDAVVLVYAAEFSKRKNQSDLIRALSKLPEKIWLLLAGRGSELDRCKALARELGVSKRVVFAGFVPDVQACYHAADICMSTSRSEGLPFNLMEAMHCALPVVATDVKGHQDLVVHGKTGYLVAFGDVDGLCSAVSELAADRAKCMELGYRGKEAVEHYALSPVLEENMALMNTFFQKRGVALPEKTLLKK